MYLYWGSSQIQISGRRHIPRSVCERGERNGEEGGLSPLSTDWYTGNITELKCKTNCKTLQHAKTTSKRYEFYISTDAAGYHDWPEALYRNSMTDWTLCQRRLETALDQTWKHKLFHTAQYTNVSRVCLRSRFCGQTIDERISYRCKDAQTVVEICNLASCLREKSVKCRLFTEAVVAMSPIP